MPSRSPASRLSKVAARLVLLPALAAPPLGLAAAANEVGAEYGVYRHLQALQGIAAANGGNRASGTPGFDRSAEYVAEQLRGAGYAVRLEEFTFPYTEERSPPVLATIGASPTEFSREGLRTLANSGAGAVSARLQAVDLGLAADPLDTSTSGCEAEDFAAFERGSIALLRRGTCPFQTKLDHAAAAGAVGVVIMNQGTGGETGIFAGRLSTRSAIPALGVATDVGRTLDAAASSPEGVSVRLAVFLETGTRATRNVIADRPGEGGGLLVAGAHLDSVPEGPGINDNGSGTAALLEAALRIAKEPAAGRPLRFAFWGAEERGLIGSRHHVNSLPEDERRRITLYINLDMVGSVNFGRFVQATGEGMAAEARQQLATFFRDRGLAVEERAGGRRRGFGTDDASFAEKNIPTVGLFTGAGEPKGEPQAARFGGTAGRPYDPCYHRACDTLDNVDRRVLDEMTEALLQVLRGAAP
jgi:Zn-dependent M28 family amino/carboxypeptidase